MSVSLMGHLQRLSHLTVSLGAHERKTVSAPSEVLLGEVKCCPDEFLDSERQTVERDKSGS